MLIIADSGSTKTSWCLLTDDGSQQLFSTQGINPFQQTESEICDVLQSELLPQLPPQGFVDSTLEIYFYGAGCTPEASPKVASALRTVISADAQVEVQSDMLGAARGLCGRKPGIVAILGTGSFRRQNSQLLLSFSAPIANPFQTVSLPVCRHSVPVIATMMPLEPCLSTASVSSSCATFLPTKVLQSTSSVL